MLEQKFAYTIFTVLNIFALIGEKLCIVQSEVYVRTVRLVCFCCM